MPSLRSLKNRIKSIKSTQKITKAMKMVAASKLRRAKEGIEKATPYANHMQSTLTNIVQNNLSIHNLLNGTGKDDVYLLMLFTSDRGLCGGFNSSIVKSFKSTANNLLQQGKEIQIICIGKKGYELIKGQYGQYIIQEISGIENKGINFKDAAHIADKVENRINTGEIDVCYMFYSHFRSVISQPVQMQQLFPLKIEGRPSYTAYEYAPSEEAILNDLLPKNLRIQIYKALLDNYASEQGARMNAMDNATRNSGEITKKLNLLYNRTRQAYITKELIEIISGAEAI